jgi:radical SAM protein with 4Fe4S-binding SPASM domain
MPGDFLFLPADTRHLAPCEAGYLRLWINSNGNMFPCAYMQDYPIGNIYKDSISDVWMNSPMLRKLRDPTLLKGACSTCNYLNGCRGGCRGLALFVEGDYLCADPYCPIVSQK